MMSEMAELNDETFEMILESEEVALVDFYASWCGQCRMAYPMFKKVAEEFATPLFKIDVEKNPKIKAMLTLEGIPTIGIFKKGEPIDAINTTKEDAFREFLQVNLKV